MLSLARFNSSCVKGRVVSPSISAMAALVASTVEALLVSTITRKVAGWS